MNCRTISVVALLTFPVLAGAQQVANPVNLWLADLLWDGGRLVVGKPVNLTGNIGVNHQPSITPDGKAVLFVSYPRNGDTDTSDVFRIDFDTRKRTQITHTTDQENSPVMLPSGELLAVRWREETLFTEYGIWRYSPDGKPLDGVLPGPDTTGYYVPLADGTFALNRPRDRSFFVALFDPRTGKIVDVDSGMASGPPHAIPGERAISYTIIDTVLGRHTIRRYDLDSRRISSLGPTVAGRVVHAWIPQHRTMLMAKANILYARTSEEPTWRIVATFDDAGLQDQIALAISPDGDKLIMGSPLRPRLATAMRDSMQAGRSGAVVSAMAIRKPSPLGEFYASQDAIIDLGGERLKLGFRDDAIAIQLLATTLFPKSHEAFASLGDAQRAVNDSTAAIASYRKALALNPRTTDTEKKAAAEVEKKLGMK